MNDEREYSEESPLSKGDYLKNPGAMEERSTFESDEFAAVTETNKPKAIGKRRSLSDAADDQPNLPPEESKEEDLTPEEAQRRTDELIQKMLAEDQEYEHEEDDMDELDLAH